MIAPLIALLSGIVATSTISAEWIDRVVRGEDVLPSLEAVQDAAVEALGVPDGEAARAWATRARWRGAFPRLEVSIGTDRDLDIRDSFSRDTWRTTTEGQALGVRVTARWELGALMFAEHELRANREAVARASALQLARERVTQIYFERLELLAQMRSEDRLDLQLRAAALDGLLRAYTGGLLDASPQKGQ